MFYESQKMKTMGIDNNNNCKKNNKNNDNLKCVHFKLLM